MRLKALNDIESVYGYPNALEYENTDYHGHQIGITAGILNEDGSVYVSYVHPTDPLKDVNEAFLEIVNNKDIKLLEDEREMLDTEGGMPQKRKVIYIPYACIDHSAFKTTINYDGQDDDKEHESLMEVEILLCKEGLNRYITIESNEITNGPLDVANAFLKDTQKLLDAGFTCVNGEWAIEMYNEVASAGEIKLGTIEDISRWVNSVRLIGIETYSEKGETEEEHLLEVEI